MSQSNWLGKGPIKARALEGLDGYEFILPDVTSQARVYKQGLRDFLRSDMALTPKAGPFEVEITLILNPNFPEIDLDNVAKAVLDGIKGHMFIDDAQVMRLLVEKRWSDGEEVRVRVWRRDNKQLEQVRDS